MPRDSERIQRITDALRGAELDAFVCALPINVLMLSGYFPVIGTSIAVSTCDSRTVLLVPEDEARIASTAGADEVRTFRSGSLDQIRPVTDAVRDSLRDLIHDLVLAGARLGYEQGEVSQPVTYAAMHLYGGNLRDLVKEVCNSAKLVPADSLLTRLRSVKTPSEVARIRAACGVAEDAFAEGAKKLRDGLTEIETANLFRGGLVTPPDAPQARRIDGFAYCMSGANAAEAYAAYQLSRSRKLARGDFALIHCNSYLDGYWTDITRTFCIAEPNDRQRSLYDAILAGRSAALNTIRPGVKASEVDAAARDALKSCGFDQEFKHGLGHAVGFEAIDHNAPPRLHPMSADVLQVGMVFNVEPGIYLEDQTGIRHCDMIAITGRGLEVLTPFQSTLNELVIRNH